MLTSLPFDWFLLLLRLLFVLLLYFFLYQIARVTARELTALATLPAARERSVALPPPATLVVVDGGDSGLAPGVTFWLQPSTIIGRHSTCAVAIDDGFISAEHAEIHYDRGHWWVRDLGSTNGTRVNGVATVVATGLGPGDVVELGRVQLRFVS